jgi:hypothetical protein
MPQIEWLQAQIDKAEETLEDIEAGVRFFRDSVETTDKHKAQLEEHIAKYQELIGIWEALDANRT